MVSGFLTSPCDHSRILSGDASEIRIALKESGSLGFSKKLKMSRIGFSFSLGKRNYDSRILGFTGSRGAGKKNSNFPPPWSSCSLFRGLVVAHCAGLDELDVQAQ